MAISPQQVLPLDPWVRHQRHLLFQQPVHGAESHRGAHTRRRSLESHRSASELRWLWFKGHASYIFSCWIYGFSRIWVVVRFCWVAQISASKSPSRGQGCLLFVLGACDQVFSSIFLIFKFMGVTSWYNVGYVDFGCAVYCLWATVILPMQWESGLSSKSHWTCGGWRKPDGFEMSLLWGCSYQYSLCPLVPGVFLSLIFRYPKTEFCKPWRAIFTRLSWESFIHREKSSFFCFPIVLFVNLAASVSDMFFYVFESLYLAIKIRIRTGEVA